MSEHAMTIASGEVEALRRCCDDIVRLHGLPETWKGRDPTSIAESVLEMLLEMLEVDFVGLRFSDTPHMFRRETGTDESGAVLAAVQSWLDEDEAASCATFAVGETPCFAVWLPLGEIARMGQLVAVSRRPGFPRSDDMLRLRTAASLASLAIREVREVSHRAPPADMRTDRPSGEALARSEWRLT